MNVYKVNSILNEDLILLILDYSNYYKEYHSKKLYRILGNEQYKKTTYIYSYIPMGCNLRMAVRKRDKRLKSIEFH